MFCPKCGSLLVPKDGKLGCSCGYSDDKASSIMRMPHIQKNDMIEVREGDGDEHLPVTEEECPSCHNDKAYFGTQQTGPSDEPEIIIYRCTKCKHTWRNTNHPY